MDTANYRPINTMPYLSKVLDSEKWKQCLDQALMFGLSLNDLSQAFDCLLLELFLAKLIAYGLES